MLVGATATAVLTAARVRVGGTGVLVRGMRVLVFLGAGVLVALRATGVFVGGTLEEEPSRGNIAGGKKDITARHESSDVAGR